MPEKSKVVPIDKPSLPTRPPAPAGHRVHRNQIIVSIGPVMYPVDYALRITELNSVPRDAAGRLTSISKSVEPPSERPSPSA